jgi:hypothetical protein
LDPGDLIEAGKIGRSALEGVAGADWDRRAGDLEWSCRDCVNHMLDSLLLFAARTAVLETRHTEGTRNGDESNPPGHLAYLVEPCSAILAQTVSLMPPGARAFHPSGMADGEGFLAMGVLEVFVHTQDVVSGLGASFEPPAELCDEVVWRIFPWVDFRAGAWERLLWASGRVALPGHPRQDDDWWIHPAPLAEWDGTVKKRTSTTSDLEEHL